MNFLIRYHRPSGEGELWQFTGENASSEALGRHFELERERESTDWEIATFATDSLETLQQTHARSFLSGGIRIVS